MPPGRLLDSPGPPTWETWTLLPRLVLPCAVQNMDGDSGRPRIAVPEATDRRALDTHYLVLIPASDWRSVLAPGSLGRLWE